MMHLLGTFHKCFRTSYKNHGFFLSKHIHSDKHLQYSWWKEKAKKYENKIFVTRIIKYLIDLIEIKT